MVEGDVLLMSSHDSDNRRHGIDQTDILNIKHFREVDWGKVLEETTLNRHSVLTCYMAN